MRGNRYEPAITKSIRREKNMILREGKGAVGKGNHAIPFVEEPGREYSAGDPREIKDPGEVQRARRGCENYFANTLYGKAFFGRNPEPDVSWIQIDKEVAERHYMISRSRIHQHIQGLVWQRGD
jgi:hypothetical protein